MRLRSWPGLASTLAAVAACATPCVRVARETEPAARKTVSGFIAAGPTVFWNVEKK